MDNHFKGFVGPAVNLARTTQFIYLYGDGFGVPRLETKRNLSSLVVEPIPLQYFSPPRLQHPSLFLSPAATILQVVKPFTLAIAIPFFSLYARHRRQIQIQATFVTNCCFFALSQPLFCCYCPREKGQYKNPTKIVLLLVNLAFPLYLEVPGAK
ncbi:unnamed protein product [Fraxinus pennsylvanica]|uniref:Uncharacterized protein n=1 Tax=Fraxinus pennsylvanica TaxID=56036 RepID=A0AAD2A8W0_9LAMI|nr:unnamed protein product [Fraxinus pennsylvanica]